MSQHQITNQIEIALVPSTPVLEAVGSSFSRNIYYQAKAFLGFSQYIQANAGITSRLTHDHFFPIHQSIIVHIFDTVLQLLERS
jgi:hypothetical protein